MSAINDTRIWMVSNITKHIHHRAIPNFNNKSCRVYRRMVRWSHHKMHQACQIYYPTTSTWTWTVWISMELPVTLVDFLSFEIPWRSIWYLRSWNASFWRFKRRICIRNAPWCTNTRGIASGWTFEWLSNWLLGKMYWIGLLLVKSPWNAQSSRRGRKRVDMLEKFCFGVDAGPNMGWGVIMANNM